MVEALRTNPLQDKGIIRRQGIEISYAGAMTLTQIWAKGEGISEILPTEPLATRQNGDSLIMWLGPDEWMIVGNADAVLEALGAGLKASVDVSHRTAGITVTGEHAADVMAAACPLDTYETVMPAGQVARSHYGKASIILFKRGHSEFDLYANRSYLDYIWDLLADASLEYSA